MGEEEAEARSMLLGYSGTERKSKSLSIFKQRLSLDSGGHLLGRKARSGLRREGGKEQSQEDSGNEAQDEAFGGLDLV